MAGEKEDLDFSKMFDELSKMKPEDPDAVPAPAETTAVEATPPAEGGETAPAETTAVEATPPAEGGETAPAETTAVEATTTEPPPAAEPKPRLTDDQILERLASLTAERKPDPAPAPAPAEAPAVYSQDEQQLLTAYEKDWPDVAKAEAIRRRGEYQQLLQYVFAEVANRLAPLENMVQGGAQRNHVDDLYHMIPDYDQVRDPVIAWVQSQPEGALKQAYSHIVQQGTPSEVSSLVTAWRTLSGAAPAPAAPAAPAAPPAPKPEVRRAAAALAPTPSVRSSGGASTEPADFDSAFASFAKAG